METRAAVVRAFELAVLGVLLLVVIGQFVGQPVLLSYVETGSMEPALSPGDGFIAVPAAISGPIEDGDVVVFDAEQLNDGGLVTHRVVGTTADGRYLTKGDANPFIDQDGVEPPVHEAQVVATAFQVGGELVAIPHLGAAVLAVSATVESVQSKLASVFRTRALLGTQGLAYLLFGLGILAYLASLLTESSGSTRRNRRPERNAEIVDARTIVVSLTLLLVLVTTASMALSGGTHSFEVISSDSDAPGHRVILKGTSETVEYTVPSNGLLPVAVYLEPRGDGIAVSPRELYVPSGSETSATVTLTAPPETGRSVLFLSEHRYLAVLPASTIRTLYGIHPWLPILAIDGLFAVGFAGLGTALLGTGRIRMRPSRHRSWRNRLERWLR